MSNAGDELAKLVADIIFTTIRVIFRLFMALLALIVNRDQ
jgi:hypothetical protein